VKRRLPAVALAVFTVFSLCGSATAVSISAGGVQPASATTAEPAWAKRLDGAVAGHKVSVSIGESGSFLYRHGGWIERAPASNMKLLTTMTMLSTFGPSYTISTRAMSGSMPISGVIKGNLWILGRGNPEVRGATMARLAEAIADAGVRSIDGRVMGSKRYFARDWWAPGWPPGARKDDVALPTALAFDGNVGPRGATISDPELRAATALTKSLKADGVKVSGKPGWGKNPSGLKEIARTTSAPLGSILRAQNIDSINFFAETFCKLLGATASGPPGTIAHGAADLESYASSLGVKMETHDCSGLSYLDRLSTDSIVRLLWAADGQTWGNAMRLTLPRPGQGTLKNRLKGVKVRAKTGTLDVASALSGWVWLQRDQTWAEFSILWKGGDYITAENVEDRIVRIVSNHAA
jgi:serine-type D-Ala-D-Ala carboxypeptidase/endopeptidase (penicillin-binding protein 4)